MPKPSTENTHENIEPPPYRKLNIFSAGGKGGVGKTTLMAALAEWFDERGHQYVLLDLDTENATKGGLQHHFPDTATKVDVNRQTGLDVFVDIVDRDENIVLGDMGAGKGQATESWFRSFFEEAQAMGVGFLLICLVTPDPASMDSVLQWAAALGDKVQYLVVLNEMSEPDAAFQLWHKSKKPQEFIERFKPEVMTMASRPSEFQELISNYGKKLGDIAGRKTDVEVLNKVRNVMHAQRHRRLLFDEFDRVIPRFLPTSS